MCGIFATTAATPHRPTLVVLATEAARRGPHAWGVVSPAGRFVTTGRLDPARLPSSGPLLGQARLASNGEWRDLEQQQPLLSGDVALVHNGVLPGIVAPGSSDTAALLPAARSGLDALMDALADLGQGEPQAALILTPREILIAPAGHPLWRLDRPEGVYIGSRPIPGAVRITAPATVPLEGDRP